MSPLPGQTPVTGVDDPEALVKSKDKKLEANKQLILDLFREVLEAHHTERISKYLAPDFIQHNPSAANGADALAGILQAALSGTAADRDRRSSARSSPSSPKAIRWW